MRSLRPSLALRCHTLLGLALLAGCRSQPDQANLSNRSPQIRAIWVTRSEYETADHVVQIMKDCAAAGFNTVLFQVRGNGTAFYRSAIEPWAEELGGEDPGIDRSGPLRSRFTHQRRAEPFAITAPTISLSALTRESETS